MCQACTKHTKELLDAGYSEDAILNWIWEKTAWPFEGISEEQVKRMRKELKIIKT